MFNRLSLGTAQFGQRYGISNKTTGRILKRDVFATLDLAYKEGIDTLDTAYSYGKSEKTIGEFTKKTEFKFRIISKFPAMDKFDSIDIEKTFHESLVRLRAKSIYGYLIHKFDDFLKYNNMLWNELENLKGKKLIKKIGFSLYNPQELEIILDKGINCDILQIPYSIFDRRFENYLEILKENDIEIHVRSVFLQGLAFLNPESLPKNLIKAKSYVETLQNIASENDISISALCLNFALLNSCVDKVTIGIDSLEHLRQNIKNLYSMEKVINIYSELERLNIEDENIVLPYKWRNR